MTLPEFRSLGSALWGGAKSSFETMTELAAHVCARAALPRTVLVRLMDHGRLLKSFACSSLRDLDGNSACAA
ncbi:hypothetical protein ACUN3E_20470 [Streptomyces sp. Ju416(a)]|uniref:hypothetical protein n=1 Tax=Streptomyces sp. Ju416(a) TaxID=3446591 RepID=UPI00403D9B17